MSNFISNILLTNAGIAVIIMVFALFRYFSRERVHIKFICILWTVIFLRMIVPVPIQSSISVIENNSIPNFYAHIEGSTSSDIYGMPEGTNTNSTEVIRINEAAFSVSDRQRAAKAKKDVNVALLLYIAGFAAAFGYITVSNVFFNRNVRLYSSQIVLDDKEAGIFSEIGVRRLPVYDICTKRFIEQHSVVLN